MYITLDILQKRGACQEALDFFAKHYPNGVEMMQAIEKAHLPDHFLHWGYQYLDPNDEEVAAYWKKIEVIDSCGIHESTRIHNSSIVSNSHDVINSEEIYKSTDVTNSNYVVASDSVYDSQFVGMSTFVDTSNRILQSKNVTDSCEVFGSKYVVQGNGIYSSDNVVNSTAIWNSNNITDCGFCFGCTNLKNSLFCEGMKDGEYLLFNKPIDAVRYQMIAKQFYKYLPEIHLTDKWKKDFGNLPRPNYDYRKHTKDITAKFWAWVFTLPGYDANILYSITFDPQFLE